MKSFYYTRLPIILSVIAIILVLNVDNDNKYWWIAGCGTLFLVVAGIIWIATASKDCKENEKIEDKHAQYEKEAELALTSEIEAIKGNSLKKELVKRRLVREYIEKNHPKPPKNADSSEYDNRDNWGMAFFCSGFVFWGALLLLIAGALLCTIPGQIPPSYYIVANAVFAIIAVVTLVWKRYYVMALVACTLAFIFVFGICTVGPYYILQYVYVTMINYIDDDFLVTGLQVHSILLLTLFSFCLMIYPFIKKWAIGLWLYIFIRCVCLPIDIAYIIWKLYMVRSVIVATFAVMTGMSYAATHMLLFVYLLSLLPVLSALPAFIRAWRACRKQDKKVRANKQYTEKCERVFRKNMIWLSINVVLMTLLWCHFMGLSFTDAQSLLEYECGKIADLTGIYYMLVYFIILVFPPLLSIIGSRLYYNYTRKQIK